MKDIDVVITWVEGRDPEWQAEKSKYDGSADAKNQSEVRYRDWDNLKYVFRGIDKFMPWVRRVHLVTWGHVPKWLKLDCPKLNVVKHTDFIPEKYLPTFNSNTIELNFNRIKDLAEQFIYFNDDMYVIKPTKATDFFVNGKPCDMAAISPQPIYRDMIMNIELNNLKILNDYFTMDDIRKNKSKWLKPFLYGQYALRTAIFMQFKTIIGIFQPHIPYTFLKSSFDNLWEKESKLLDSVCENKFRTTEDINLWLARSWQLLSGNFVPRTRNFGLLIPSGDEKTVDIVLSGKTKHKMICLNDDDSVKDFEVTKKHVIERLERLYPEKSAFEK